MPRIPRITVAVALAAALAALTLAELPASAATPGWTQLAPAAEPQVNPLKGFVPYQGAYSTFPHSMEWSYFPVNAAMTGPGAFDWSVVDAALDDIASRGHQTALRFYLDYPGKPSGVPQFLLDGGLATHAYGDYGNNGVSVAPDYDDPRLRSALGEFVAALGARYDGDPRIGFLQAGLLGFWGEWHTYPYTGENGQPQYMASDATQREILTDVVNAFPTTEVEVRNPDPMNASMPVGYHDDSFALETLAGATGYHFLDRMAVAPGKWQQHSIGGELRPELQACIFSAGGCPALEEGGDNDFPGSVAQTHASWLLNQYAFESGYPEADRQAALAGATSLGYSFRATEALVPASTGATTVSVGMTVGNIGVAPFYYAWPITLAYVDGAGAVAASTVTPWHVGDIASGASTQFTGTFDVSAVPAGSYTLVAQVTNPLGAGSPIRFADAGQDTVKDGWLTLGTTTFTR